MKESLKKSLVLLLTVVMVLGASPLSGIGGLDLHLPEWLKSPFSVDADAADVSDLLYYLSNGDVEITSCKTSASGTLTIPATIEGYPVTGIDNRAFYGCSSLESIKIPSGVTSIGDGAFYGCRSLESITVAADNASYSSDERGVLFNKNKTELIKYPTGNTATSYTIPSGVTSIGDGVFKDCNSLESIEIPSGVTSIGRGAFYDTGFYNNSSNWVDDVLYIGEYLIGAECSISGLCTVKPGTKLIADSAFSDCGSLENIEIPYGVTSIGDYAFSWCASLTSITIPVSVTRIGDGAFSVCIRLASIEVPSGVTSIGDSAFDGCEKLTSITVAQDNAYYSSDERGVLFNKSKTELIQYPAANTAASYTIPSGVTSIGDSAFDGCSSLKSIKIPSGVTSIGDWAFSVCGSLESIEIPSGVTSIGDSAFDGCSSLKSIKIPSGVTNISDSAFYRCSNLKSIKIPSGVTSIGDYAFENCSSLTRLHIPPSVTTIGRELLSSDSACTICSTTETAYAKTYAEENGFTFDVCKGHTVSTIAIKNLNNSASINYGDTLRLTAVTTDMPEGAKVAWSVHGTGVRLKASADGTTCDVTPTASGTVTVTAKIVDASGNPMTDYEGNEIASSQQIKSNANCFLKLIAHFKKLFGSTKTIVQAVDE